MIHPGPLEQAHYAFVGSTAQVRPPRRLAAIDAAAEEARRLAMRLDEILERFDGPRDQAMGSPSTSSERPALVSYEAALDRLAAHLAWIDKTITQIEEFA